MKDKNVIVRLSPLAAQALEEMYQNSPGKSRNRLICEAIILLSGMMKQKGKDEPVGKDVATEDILRDS